MDEYSKWHEIATPCRKDRPTLTRWFMALIRRIQRMYDADVIAVRCDNERGFGNDLIGITEELGMLHELAPPGTKEPNGLIERAGGVLTQRARSMRIHANLPKSLSHEMYRTAAYILNRTPIEALGWKTPYEIVLKRKPLVAHMRPIGCRAYVYNRDLRAADKLESRTLIGHLVGYQGTNRMDSYASTPVIQEVIELLEYPDEYQEDDITIEDLLTVRQRRYRTEAPTTSVLRAGGSQVGGEMVDASESPEASRINVRWVPTGRMPADGLTKILPKQKFTEFVRQLGLVDISKRLQGIKQTCIDNLNALYLGMV
jgi:hypothetical protein